MNGLRPLRSLGTVAVGSGGVVGAGKMILALLILAWVGCNYWATHRGTFNALAALVRGRYVAWRLDRAMGRVARLGRKKQRQRELEDFNEYRQDRRHC